MVHRELDEIVCNANYDIYMNFQKHNFLTCYYKASFPPDSYLSLARLPETHNKPEDVPTMLLVLYLHVS